ncbi:uncharacterized protein KZ484_016914 [Pholidichthys leucotaenia]
MAEEECIGRERKKFNITRILTVKLQRLVILEPHHWKEEEEDDFTDQQLCKQERDSSLNQENQKVSRVREEQLDLKQEADTFMVTPSYEENSQGQSVPNRERLLPHNALKTESQHPGADIPRLHDYKEEVLTVQQLCNQQRNFSLDKQIKEDEQQLGLKQKTDSFMVTPFYEKNDQSQTEPKREQLLCHNFSEIEIQNQKASNHVKPGSTNHKKPKNGKSLFFCESCGKSFKQRYFLGQHLRIHNGEKPYCCQTCGKSFTASSSLTTHMRIHSGEKPYSCKTCGKHFSQRSHLSRHMGIHTNVKPFSCKTCGKSFICKDKLARHLETHKGLKPYSCETCGQRFATHQNLKGHLRIHQDDKSYTCKTCGKSFTSDSGLTYHTRTHTGQNLHSCESCGKCFVFNSLLRKHMLIHTGEKPFSCEICGKSFTGRHSLVYHMTTHKDLKKHSHKTVG